MGYAPNTCPALLGNPELTELRPAVVVSPFWPAAKQNWSPGIGTDNELTTYFLRSHPKGRIGKPLDEGEVRMTSVYVADRTNSIAKIVVSLSFLVGHVDLNACCKTSLRESYSVAGIPLLSPLSFDDQTAPFDRSGTCARNATGHRMILTSTVQVLHANALKSFRTGQHDYALAAIVAGVPINDSVRRCYEITTEQRYDQAQVAFISQLTTQIAMKRPEFTKDVVKGNPNHTAGAAFALNAARIAADMLSAAGLVDIIASPIAAGALPDAMLHPLHLPLALALLTRMAAKPAQYQLLPGTSNDLYAARELSELMEAQFHPILRLPDGENLWAIDVCATVALTQVKAQVAKIKKKKDRDAEETGMDQSLNALFSLGVGLTNDVIGSTIPEEIYSDMGMADKVCGPIENARAKAAATKGLGKMGSNLSTMRVSSRAARQKALVNILCEVEEFLRTGRCKKLQLAATSVAGNKNEQPQDENGFVTIPSFEGCDVETTLARATSRDAFLQAREQLQNLLLRGPVVLNTFTLNCYVASRYSKVPCVECGCEVDVFGGVIFAQAASECSICCGKRCWQCAMLADPKRETCKHCLATPTGR
jgi:hypothetical protein